MQLKINLILNYYYLLHNYYNIQPINEQWQRYLYTKIPSNKRRFSFPNFQSNFLNFSFRKIVIHIRILQHLKKYLPNRISRSFRCT